jgi:outer membrane receptor for ferrienterochelin and colicin
LRIPRLIISVSIIFIFSLQVFSGTTGKIAGQIIDKANGEPLIGVNVILQGTTMGATTDLDGYYLILNLPPGKYNVQFLYIGYREVITSGINVNVDLTTTLNMEMETETMELEEAIQVVAEREMVQRDLTSSQSTVTAEDITSIPTEQFEEVLQLQAGVTRGDNGSIHIRGGRSSEVGYWVDGVSVTDSYDNSNGVEIENNAVQSLQVISGTFNAEYGQSMSGIINIVTKDGSPLYQGNVSAYAGDYFSPANDVFLNIDDVNPAHIYDFRFNLSGPIPLTEDRLTFFTNFRINNDDGYFYGQRTFNTDGTPGNNAFVALGGNRWLSSQNKLTYRLTDLIKLRVGFNYEDRDFREYDHFWKFNPDGDFKKFQTGYNVSATIDHTLSNRTFYTLKYSRFDKKFKQYVYENPEDPRYVDINLPQYATAAFQFSAGGQKNQRFERNTISNIIKFDISSQVSNKHLLKAGVETRLHELDLLDFETINGTPSDTFYTPVVPPKDNINYGAYNFKPVEFSAYIQDKMEYGDFIINLGLRFDYFDSKGNVLIDPMDPNIFAPFRPEYEDVPASELADIWYKDPSPKTQLSPRVGLAFPISASGVIHASYGHFSQIAEFRLLYENPGFKISRGNDNLVGNSDLEPQRTVMYEIGLQQQLTSVVTFDITGFYRDVRNWVSTSPLVETYRPNFFYSKYENRDYANVRGITVSVNKSFANYFSGNITYTAMVAEGSASNPEDAFNDIKSNKEPRKTIIPLGWDRRQVLNGNIFMAISNFSFGLLGRYENGLPYTPNPIQGTTRGSNVQSGFSGLRENSSRRPNLITFDLQAYYDIPFDIGSRPTKFTLFFKVYNLLDRRNEINVWADTGRATYTQEINVSGADADPEWVVRPDYYSGPRRILVGLSYDF